MLRRSFLQSGLGAAAAGKRYHVLFVAVDDLRPQVGCYGAPVQTPHIDRLARRGVRFDRAYCQYPLCNPSRTSLLTGRRPPRTGVMENQTWFRDKLPDVVTLPQHFRQHGYLTMATGKIFHGGLDDDRAWDIGSTPLQRQAQRTAAEQKERQKTADRWVALPGEGEETIDYRTGTRAVELLSQKHDKPFFLAVGFAKPHVPFIAPKKYFDLYPPDKMPLPPDFAPEPVGSDAAYRPNFDIFIRRPAAAQEAREMIAGYRAATTFMDAQLGRVLNALDRSGLANDTVVVFFGDHGFHLGEKGMWSKQTLFEAGTRVPLIIAAPGMAAGKVSAGTVELVDLYPTLAELCGLAPPPGADGESLTPLLRTPGARWNHPAYSYIRRPNGTLGASVRTARYRYTEWGGARPTELYDHRNDPGESRNLAGDSRAAQVVAEHQKLLQ